MDKRPGLNPKRLARLISEAVVRCQLDLNGCIVLTEAATGPYVVTPILAAIAGAQQTFALTHASKYGNVEEVIEQTHVVAELCGVTNKIKVLEELNPEILEQADVVTNSGHLRPIDSEMVRWMKPSCVIPLMYEAWEFRPSDVDIESCRKKGIAVAGTNERHPAIDIFSYLGIMAVKLLLDAGISLFNGKVIVMCDNAFGPFIVKGLNSVGAEVITSKRELPDNVKGPVDAILVALQPRSYPILDDLLAKKIASQFPGTVVAQFWGDIDRIALFSNSVSVWPLDDVDKGHMGILPSAVGPGAIVRLQAGGLKVGQVLHLSPERRDANDLSYVQFLNGY